MVKNLYYLCLYPVVKYFVGADEDITRIILFVYFISPDNLRSQQFLDDINQWTIKQKMRINLKKTKTMIFN